MTLGRTSPRAASSCLHRSSRPSPRLAVAGVVCSSLDCPVRAGRVSASSSTAVARRTPRAAADSARTAVAALDDVAAVTPAVLDRPATPRSSPSPSSPPADPPTSRRRSRRGDPRPAAAGPGRHRAELFVTGNTALGIDISDKLTQRRACRCSSWSSSGCPCSCSRWPSGRCWYRSRPLRLLLLSLAATFGALVAVFQWGWFADVVGSSRPCRSSASCRCSSRSCSDSRWTTRSSSSAGSVRTTSTGKPARGRHRRLPPRPRCHRGSADHGLGLRRNPPRR